MKITKIYMIALLAAVFALSSCGEDEERVMYDNRVFINSTTPITNLLIKKGIPEYTRTIQAALAQPAKERIGLYYRTDQMLVARYNAAYYDNAEMLPSGYYSIPDRTAIIEKDAMTSTGVEVHFNNIDNLNRDKTYVLPVILDNATNVGILENGRYMYFVFKGAALINVVANTTKNSFKVTWATPSLVNSMGTITMEALVRASAFSRPNSDSEIYSVMGIEGRFLIRTGDSNHPGQLQVATNSGNYPEKDASKILPLNKWVHIAVTYNNSTRNMKIYVNGKVQSDVTTTNIGNVNLTHAGSDNNGFNLGKSWNDDRWWDGEFSEMRVWNVIRTQQEIEDGIWEVDPETPGLVAYWKFDEGDGDVINDHTGNGNHARALNPVVWVPVSLPPVGWGQ